MNDTEEKTFQAVKEWQRDTLKFHIVCAEWSERLLEVGYPYIHNYYCGYVTFLGRPVPNDTIDEIDVHGGVTLIEENEDGSYTYGFDCGHYGDVNQPHLQDLAWVQKECESMAAQILALGNKSDCDKSG